MLQEEQYEGSAFEILRQVRAELLNLEVVAVRLAAQGISHYISLARGIGYTVVVSAISSIHRY